MKALMQQRAATLCREIKDHELALAFHHCGSCIMSVHDMSVTRSLIRTCKGTLKEIDKIMKEENNDYMEKFGRENTDTQHDENTVDSSIVKLVLKFPESNERGVDASFPTGALRIFKRKASIKIL